MGGRQDEFRENEAWEGGSLNLIPPLEGGPHVDRSLVSMVTLHPEGCPFSVKNSCSTASFCVNMSQDAS